MLVFNETLFRLRLYHWKQYFGEHKHIWSSCIPLAMAQLLYNHFTTVAIHKNMPEPKKHTANLDSANYPI